MDNKTPLISVIVPAYNTAKFVGKCIESIQNNSYKNLEIIIVNDGSADNTADVVSSYAAKDDRIVLINKENGGVSRARNTGIDAAKGEYIAFVDSDDYISEDFLETLIKPCIEHGAESAVSSYQMVTPDGKPLPCPKTGFTDDFFITPQEVADNYFKYLDMGVVNFVNRIHKRSVVGDIRFSETLKWGEDGSFNLEVFRRCKKIYATPRELYYYVMHSNQATAKKMPGYAEMITEHIGDIDRYLTDYGAYDKLETRQGMGKVWNSIFSEAVYHSFSLKQYKETFFMFKKQPWFKFVKSSGKLDFKRNLVHFSVLNNAYWLLYFMVRVNMIFLKVKRLMK
ncbi:MAG: glycosyltransferase family 2 protein [Clostridia bacterium]|nr:glycosyltransferase family 2 protein [Clostridia bacterium]